MGLSLTKDAQMGILRGRVRARAFFFFFFFWLLFSSDTLGGLQDLSSPTKGNLLTWGNLLHLPTSAVKVCSPNH